MRRYLIMPLLLLPLLAGSCDFYEPVFIEAGESERLDLEIHLNNNFDDDVVEVRLDDRRVFRDRITTNYVWSLAETIKLQRSAGRHEIAVTINDDVSAATTIDLDRPLFVLVRYYPEAIPALGLKQGVHFDVSDERPLYD